jgi:murein DD-endopeptidase MepM/ murein hydrolase activator NlpD
MMVVESKNNKNIIEHITKLRRRYVFTKHGDLRLRVVCALVVFMTVLVGFGMKFEHSTSNFSVANITANEAQARPQTPEDVFMAMQAHPSAANTVLEHDQEGEAETPAVEEMARIVIPTPTAKPLKRMFTVQSGDNLSSILERASLSKAETYQIIQALENAYNPRDMRVGQKILIDVEKNETKDIVFNGLYIQKNQLDFVKLAKAETGYDVKSLQRKFKTRTGFADATIDQTAPSIYIALREQGVPNEIIAQLIRYYSWDLDFQRDVHPGNRIRVLYEHGVMDNGESVNGHGKLIYASYSGYRGDLPMYRYEKENGDVDYYNDKGMSVRKALLSTPVDGARLSSGFGRRKHPVLGYQKMHKGVDFAAPRGTPIYAAGDGIVEKAEWFSSFGNYVRIRHNGELKTAYAHMKGFGKGVRKGVRVKQGQIIGYIGTTGRSTGPHLHYEVHKNGVQVNPNSLKLPTGEKLAGEKLDSFMAVKAMIDRKAKDLSKDPARIAFLKKDKETGAE